MENDGTGKALDKQRTLVKDNATSWQTKWAVSFYMYCMSTWHRNVYVYNDYLPSLQCTIS